MTWSWNLVQRVTFLRHKTWRRDSLCTMLFAPRNLPPRFTPRHYMAQRFTPRAMNDCAEIHSALLNLAQRCTSCHEMGEQWKPKSIRNKVFCFLPKHVSLIMCNLHYSRASLDFRHLSEFETTFKMTLLFSRLRIRGHFLYFNEKPWNGPFTHGKYLILQYSVSYVFEFSFITARFANIQLKGTLSTV